MSELVREDQNWAETDTVDASTGITVLSIIAMDSGADTKYTSHTLDLRQLEDEEDDIPSIEIPEEELNELQEISEDMRRGNRVNFRDVEFDDDEVS